MVNTNLGAKSKLGFYQLAPEQLQEAVNVALAAYKGQIAAIKNNPVVTWHSSIQPLEEAAESLDRLWGLLEHENAVVSRLEVRKIYEQLLPLVSGMHTELLQDKQLHDIYLRIKQSTEFTTLTAPQQAIIEHALRDFKLAGVDLPAMQRAEFKSLYTRLAELENTFSNNVLDATEGWTYHITTAQKDLLAGLPQHIITAAQNKATAEDKSGWILTLDYPNFVAVLTYADSRELREEFYLAYNTRASDQGPLAGQWDNTSVITEILAIRQKLAELTGYKNFVEYSLVTKMAENSVQAKEFLHSLLVKVKPQGVREYAELQTFAKQQNFMLELSAWDIPYFAEKQRKAKFAFSEEELRPYFPVTRVLHGLFNLVKNIFGLHIIEVPEFITWHASVRMFKVLDQNKQLRGHFYTDLYAREGKRGGAWMSECVTRIRFASDLLQNPIAYLNCNFAPPDQSGVGLLTHNDVTVLFHEFGHTLHHILSQVDYYSVSGLNGVEWDAVELPSQFMENWAWQWQVIQDISAHVETGQSLPKEIYDNLWASKNYNAGMFLLRQLEFALFDLLVHENHATVVKKGVHAVLQQVRDMVAVVKVPANNRFENSFSHIFAGGYAAGYYSYLWAEVLSCDAFNVFKQNGLFNAKIGHEFLSKILEKGGAYPAMELFVDFTGRKPEVAALLEYHGIGV